MSRNENLSVAELEQLLESRRAELNELVDKREALAAELAELDGQIAAMNGEPVEGGGRRRKARKVVRKRRPGRARNQPPLREVVAGVLEKQKKGLTLKELEEKVIAAGYQTNSAKFGNTLYQTMYNARDRFDYDGASKIYKLKSE